MSEYLFVNDSADIGDDFSLASGFDEIDYGDPFNSNHNNNDGADIGSKKDEMLTEQNSAFNTKNREMINLGNGPPKTIGELNACLFEASSVENGTTTSGSVLKTKDAKKKKQASYSILKPEIVAVKARKSSTKSMIKLSKSDGLLTLALKARYRKSTAQQSTSTNLSFISSGSSSPHMNDVDGIGDKFEPASGKANASWHSLSGSQAHTNSVDRLDNRGYSLAPVKSSSMHDLLLQSKAQCKSQFLLRQSSAHSLSKRNSFQSIKYVNEKLDVSSLLPSKRYAKSRSASRSWSFPNVATTASTSKHSMNLMSGDEVASRQSTNDSVGDMTDSLLHDACRLFPNSDTVVETALRVDPNAIRRSVIYNHDQVGDSPPKSNSSIYGYPINLAIANGANEKILKLLAQSGSDVLAFKDGTNCGASLGIALSSKKCNLAIVDLLLSANDQCAQIADRRGNYPLHIAVSYGRSVEIVERLHTVYAKAQNMRNFHSQTPLDIAIQSSRCPEEVIDFLRSVSCRISCSDDTIINTKRADVNQSFGSLEEGLDDIMEINC